MEKISKKRLFLLISVLLLVVLTYLFLKKNVVTVAPASYHPIVKRFVAMGRVYPPDRITLKNQRAGYIQHILVDDGDSVKKGDILVELDKRYEEITLKKAQAQLQEYQANLQLIGSVQHEQAKAQYNEKKRAYKNAELELQRTEKLFREGDLAQSKYEIAQLNFAVTTSELTVSRLEYESFGEKGAHYLAARSLVSQGIALVDEARLNVEKMTLLAPVNGVILYRFVNEGDLLQSGDTVFTMIEDSDKQILVQAEEQGLSMLSVGQIAIVSAEAYPDETFEATISLIAPLIDKERGTVDIRLTIEDPPLFLKADMTVSVDIEVQKKTDSLIIPREALYHRKDRKAIVYLVEDGRLTSRSVQCGIENNDYIEIIDGLKEGELVLLQKVDGLEIGDQVSIRYRKD